MDGYNTIYAPNTQLLTLTSKRSTYRKKRKFFYYSRVIVSSRWRRDFLLLLEYNTTSMKDESTSVSSQHSRSPNRIFGSVIIDESEESSPPQSPRSPRIIGRKYRQKSPSDTANSSKMNTDQQQQQEQRDREERLKDLQRIMKLNNNMSSNHNSSQSSLIDVETAERTWARELYEMNSSTREEINYELHGVQSRAVPEEPSALAEALRLFQIEIDTQIPIHQKRAHIRAVVGLKSNYVRTSEFRLRFLRAERFDVQKAAIRYCKGLDYLVESFGEQALLRQLYLSDLSKDEERFLKKGLKQLLPTRDRFGRRIMAHFGSYSNEYTFETRSKVVTYLCFGVLAEDLTTQRNGVVSLGFFSYDNNDLLVMERKRFLRFFEGVPLRWSAFHLCIPNNPAYNVIKGLLLTVIPKEIRQITRVHSGT